MTDDALADVCMPFSFVAVVLPFSRERELDVVDGCKAMLFDGESCRGSLTSTTESRPLDVVLDLETGFEDMEVLLAGVVESDMGGAREEEGMLWFCPVDVTSCAGRADAEAVLAGAGGADGTSNSAGRTRGVACTLVIIRACLENSS